MNNNICYKRTKIVRALWLAERSVCLRVCKHGCGVKMFCFSCANHASMNVKKFSSSKLDQYTLFTNSFVGWNLENRYKEGVSIFFRLSWQFKQEKSVFWIASFCKTRTDFRVQDVVEKTLRLERISLLICAITKSFGFFSRQLCKPSTSSWVCLTVSNSPNPSRVYIRLCKHEKGFLLLNWFIQVVLGVF